MSDLRQKFYQDPDWKLVEAEILAHIQPLLDISTVDTSQPAEHVKAEIVGRRLAHESLSRFLQGAGMVAPRPSPEFKNPYR